MTKNQIEYAKLLETRRANQKQEEMTHERDYESARHNLATESISRSSLDETSRSNKAREAETARNNLALESLTRARDAETARANLEREKENFRSNAANESIKLSTLQETQRSNVAQEGLRSRELGLRSREIDLKSEELSVKRDSLQETIRSNMAKENETMRSNLAKEYENNRSNVAKEWEQSRSNQANESETHRHNVVSEATNAARAATYAVDVGGRLIYYNKDFSTDVVVTPVNTVSVGNQGNSTPGNTGLNDGGPNTNNPNRPTPNPGNGHNSNVTVGGSSNETGKTFWDVASEIQSKGKEQQQTNQSQKGFGGGQYGSGASRSSLSGKGR